MQSGSDTHYRTEARFVELFQDVFGPAAAAKLEAQYPYEDIDGRGRSIDFALESLLDRYAIEIDGETFHHPAALTSTDYADQLMRQNSLTHFGWRILRWSDWQLHREPERVKEHLAILLDAPVRLVVPQEHLPCKRGALIPLFEHQREALDSLDEIRRAGNQIAMLPHAVGSGKTTTAVEDARRLGLRTLFLAHTHELVDQAQARFAELWPEASRARLGDSNDHDARVVVGTIQTMQGQIGRFATNEFGYIVIDEAHHATARSYQAVLRYFDPVFLLGLTGTPERSDGVDSLEVFCRSAHRMDLATAVREGILCDIRCFRVATNVDLGNLRFNGALYQQKDLERRVRIPERDSLIVDTYCENVRGRRAVTFCVSVGHAEEIARRFRDSGVPAAAVSGQLSREERRKLLDAYNASQILVLCACDVLNEGWDAPETEVLLMARPTLSKVIYQQQIGRGMRKYPGKECLVLFDFVDAFSRYNRALSLHRLLRKPHYGAGKKVFGDDDNAIPTELPIHLWATDYELLDVFDWQERVEGMVTMRALSALLRKSEGWVESRWRDGRIKEDEIVDLGGGVRVPYFARERVPEIRGDFGLDEVTPDTLYDDFCRFVTAMDTTFSYKPVWLKALLRCVDSRGHARVTQVRDTFHQFYRDREQLGVLVERANSKMSRPSSLSPTDVQQVINQGPFDRFSRLDFVGYARDRAIYAFDRNVWERLSSPSELEKVLMLCEDSIEEYFRSAAR